MSRSTSISVALPVYNATNYLREALDSILSQTFEDFEVIVSDNASTDETPAICREYSQRDARIRVSRSEQFLQQADNVNRAVELCSGEWIKLFCHDDLMLPNCLDRIRELADACPPSVGLIGNGEQWLFANAYRYPQGEDFSVPEMWVGHTLIRRALKGKAVPPLPSLTTATIRKAAWNTSRKFDSRFAHFDAFLWTTLLVDWDYAFIPQILTVNRIHSGQVAVSARKSTRSIEDHKIYWTEFLRECGGSLKLSWMERLMIRLRPMGIAASALAIEILRGNIYRACAIFFKSPPLWWLILPVLTARSYYRERQKLGGLIHHVPVHDIYP
jgi:glycosyltransferase involved in cell wall biosynthesis